MRLVRVARAPLQFAAVNIRFMGPLGCILALGTPDGPAPRPADAGARMIADAGRGAMIIELARVDLRLPRGGRGRGRPSAASGDRASLQSDRPGPSRAVPPDLAATRRRRKGDRGPAAAVAPVRIAARARIPGARERDGGEPDARGLPRR